jgi:hypothetical protein
MSIRSLGCTPLQMQNVLDYIVNPPTEITVKTLVIDDPDGTDAGFLTSPDANTVVLVANETLKLNADLVEVGIELDLIDATNDPLLRIYEDGGAGAVVMAVQGGTNGLSLQAPNGIEFVGEVTTADSLTANDFCSGDNLPVDVAVPATGYSLNQLGNDLHGYFSQSKTIVGDLGIPAGTDFLLYTCPVSKEYFGNVNLYSLNVTSTNAMTPDCFALLDATTSTVIGTFPPVVAVDQHLYTLTFQFPWYFAGDGVLSIQADPALGIWGVDAGNAFIQIMLNKVNQ